MVSNLEIFDSISCELIQVKAEPARIAQNGRYLDRTQHGRDPLRGGGFIAVIQCI